MNVQQPDLFALPTPKMIMTALFGGPNDTYRYELERIWDGDLPILVVCMLNPSTADHRKNDPTVLALIHFAAFWGYGGIRIVNLFAFRSSSPDAMMAAPDPFGPGNGAALERAMAYAAANGGRLLCAWGNGGDYGDRDEWFCNRAHQVYRLDLICLGVTKDNKPKHPMARGKHRIARDQQPQVWRSRPTERAA